MSPIILVLLTIMAVAFIAMVVSGNNITRLRNLVSESRAQLEVALKRRHDLIPALLSVARSFAAHEEKIIDQVTAALVRASKSSNDAATMAAEEQTMVNTLNVLLQRLESYPQLKSSEHFLHLQHELVNTEDRIAAARRFYNSNVRDYNIAIEQFPGSVLAKGARKAEYFEIESIQAFEHPLPELLRPVSPTAATDELQENA